jgi:hypothetical protein
MEDKELFELCKQVYGATGWDGYALKVYDKNGDVTELKDLRTLPDFPQYTSDYILEKLPVFTSVQSAYTFDDDYQESVGFEANHMNSDTKTYRADTPLKALLKLTLALYEAGELK